MQKRILLVANLNSLHVYNYIKNVLAYEEYSICCIQMTEYSDSIDEHYLDYYNEIGLTIVYPFKEDREKLHLHSAIKELCCMINKLGHFDIVHVHYVVPTYVMAVYLSRKNFDEIVVSFWGSDLMRSGIKSQILMIPLLKKAKYISFISKEMLDSFRNNCLFRTINKDKCLIVGIGDYFFDLIRNKMLKDDYRINAKSSLGIDPDKIVVTIGHNGLKPMQQLETALSISRITDNKIKNQIIIVYPCVGMSVEDKERIEDLMTSSGFDYILLHQRLNDNELVDLRLATDIFIHPQRTDALSNSVLEHLFTGGILLNASWLKYSKLDEHGILYYKFDSFSTIDNDLVYIINNYSRIRYDMKNNIPTIYELASWEFVKKLWTNMYI